MTQGLRTAANAGGVVLIVVGSLLAAMRAPYVLALLTGGAGLALVLGVGVHLRRRAGAALEALAAGAGTQVTEAQVDEAEAAAWVRGMGLSSLERDTVRRVRRKSVQIPGGSVHVVAIRIGAGKTTGLEAVILCAPTSGTAIAGGRDQALIRRARELGAGSDVAVGIGESGACLYAAGPPAELLAPEAAREILASLAALGRP